MKKFLADRRGHFSIMAALLAVPLLVVAALSIDLALAYRDVSNMQEALDSGLLAAGRVDGTIGQKRQVAYDFLKPQIVDLELRGMTLDVAVDETKNGLEGTVTAHYPTRMFSLFGIRSLPIAVNSAVAKGTGGALDAVLVLDNTFSLGPTGLKAVKDAAKSFSDGVFAASADPTKVQIGVVPFAGVVNVGRGFNSAYLDRNADATYHASQIEEYDVAQIDQTCVPNWGGGGGGAVDPGGGAVEGALRDESHKFAWSGSHLFGELFGVGAATAAADTPQNHGLPAGYYITTSGGCDFLYSPPKISNFDLFGDISNAAWGGCVEARADPYDTTDDTPTASDPDTLFVPYFWPDEPDPTADFGMNIYTNNYMADATPAPWTPSNWAKIAYWGAQAITTKYKANPATLNADGQYMSGPNLGCPTSLRPLTKTKANVTATIDAMALAQGGGTVISEGVAWGWRVLSPRAPFTEGNADRATKRVLVVMSDGENQLSRNPKLPDYAAASGPVLTDYNAYGYLRSGRLQPENEETYAGGEADLDRRTLAICDNAKRDGIEIHTVLFNSTATRAINTLKACASDNKFFYHAADAAQLEQTFKDIAANIGRYRLVK